MAIDDDVRKAETKRLIKAECTGVYTRIFGETEIMEIAPKHFYTKYHDDTSIRCLPHNTIAQNYKKIGLLYEA